MAGRWLRSLLLLGTVAGLAGISVYQYYVAVHEMLDYWNSWHARHLTLEQADPLQYRLLSYLLPEGLVRATGMEPWQAYIFQRFFFLFTGGYFFYVFARHWLTRSESVFALLAFFYLYNLTIYPHFQPSEEINICFFLLGFAGIEWRKFSWLLIAIALGTLNKQTVIFLVPVYIAFEYFRTRKLSRALLTRSALLTVLFFGLRFAIRWWIGERPPFPDPWPWETNLRMLIALNPQTWYFALPTLVPMGLICASWRTQPLLMRALVPTIVLFVLCHFLVSLLYEFRTMMPLALVTIPASILYLRELATPEAPAQSSGDSPTADCAERQPARNTSNSGS